MAILVLPSYVSVFQITLDRNTNLFSSFPTVCCIDINSFSALLGQCLAHMEGQLFFPFPLKISYFGWGMDALSPKDFTNNPTHTPCDSVNAINNLI